MKSGVSRRHFIGSLAAVSTLPGGPIAAQRSTGIRGFDHVALPMQKTEEMIAFYQGLGLPVIETPNACSVYFGDQMVNFHRPAYWQDKTFTLRASAAMPPCGDLCFVWDDTPESLRALLEKAGARIVEGPVQRHGGRRRAGTSTYTRDPDGNLLEFLIYS